MPVYNITAIITCLSVCLSVCLCVCSDKNAAMAPPHSLVNVKLSTHSHHPRSHHPSLLHTFTPGSKPTFSTNPFHLNIVLYPMDCFHDNGTGIDLSRSSVYFLVFSFTFLSVQCYAWTEYKFTCVYVCLSVCVSVTLSVN